MPVDLYKALLKVFRLDEGEELTPYRDSKKYWTIGIGHFIGDELSDLRLSPHVIEEIFKEDIATAIQDARQVVGGLLFDDMSPARQVALISMLFTLGRDKFLKFEKAIDAIKCYDWNTVALEVLNSKWAKDVDPNQQPGLGRDDRIAYMFQTGEFHRDYNV